MAPMLHTSPSSEVQSRDTRPIPTALLDTIGVTLEEELYPHAFSQLTHVLTSGTSAHRPLPSRIPPPKFIALAVTVSIHPSLTTRTRDVEKLEAADAALAYLRRLLHVVGVRASGLAHACVFTPQRGQSLSRARRSAKKSGSSRGFGDDESEEDEVKIRSSYAGRAALWANAEDFWHLVGWALNCSVLHRQRWNRYLPLLDWMLNAIRQDFELYAEGGTAAESILAQYLSVIGEGRNNKRRVMRAILADGSPRSTGEFVEIWRKETKPPKRKQEDEGDQAKKKSKLDLEAGEYGDYYNDSNSDVDSPAGGSLSRSRNATAARSRTTSRQPSNAENESGVAGTSGMSSALAAFGGIESIQIRKRMLALLVHLSLVSPKTFLDIENLFDLYTEFLRPLPLPVFQQLVFTGCSGQDWLGVNEQSSLDQMLLRPLLASAAPAYDRDALTQTDFETHYAPYPANTTSATDNAKVSLLIEDLFRLLWRTGGLIYTDALRGVVEDGIKARKDKLAFDGRKKTKDRKKEDEDAGTIMDCSAQRMLVLLDMIKARGEQDP
ncbi:hypothetical protein B0A50_02504 [Salinomyces thailandicus]|uniref:Uncharacterized protein n=1 Tax=Salinomyces thailandicus TaxID=706561 RepID=A0A4U0U705_9PEZI|nr:hypothetical protein B0A50_02504 [Salinomyces thailandica]